MGRRGSSRRVPCSQTGCTEAGWFEYDTQREAVEHARELTRRPYLCVRHRDADEVLAEGNAERVHVLVASKVPFRDGESLPGLYWLPEGGTSGSGFAHGPGFKAFAKDFPEGTRLVVTARVEPPGASSGFLPGGDT